MSDLVKRLRGLYKPSNKDAYIICDEAADKIEQLERELAEWKKDASDFSALASELTDKLAAEKALADDLEKIAHGVSWDHPARAAYRKARGL